MALISSDLGIYSSTLIELQGDQDDYSDSSVSADYKVGYGDVRLKRLGRGTLFTAGQRCYASTGRLWQKGGNDATHFKKTPDAYSFFVFVALLLLVLAYAVFDTYDVYTQMVIEQQQQQSAYDFARGVAEPRTLYIRAVKGCRNSYQNAGFLAAVWAVL